MMGKYLLPQLKHYLLTLAYAVNAKMPGLKLFLNPNLVRLHDFNDNMGRTAWNYCGTPDYIDDFSKYTLSGGLSRLNITMAGKWRTQLFGRIPTNNPAPMQSLLVNLMHPYPVRQAPLHGKYDALLVEFGKELLEKSRDNKPLRNDLLKALPQVTAGFHYRVTVRYLTGKRNVHNLFLSEIKALGEFFFKKGKYLTHSTAADGLTTIRQQSKARTMEFESVHHGNIYYYTFENLRPSHFRPFPHEAAIFMRPLQVGGEMIEEFRLTVDYHCYKQGIPHLLQGSILTQYLKKTAPRTFHWNHTGDYFSTHLGTKPFNADYLKRFMKNLQKEGGLKLQ